MALMDKVYRASRVRKVLREIEAYIETELCDEMRAIALEIDREFMEGAGTGAVLGVLKV